MAARDPQVRTAAARQAIHTRWSRASQADRKAATEAARAARRQQLEDRVDPERKLDPADRDARVRALVRAELARIARLGVEARRAKRRAAEDAELDRLIEAEQQ
jgi:hypothetical protein